MESLELNGSCIVFHAYENGEKVESFDFFHHYFNDIPTNVVEETTLDLTKYKEVHIREESDDDTYYDFKDGEELPDDHVFDVKITHVILPNKESWDMIDIVDENIDFDSFETSSGNYGIYYKKVTEEGEEIIEDPNVIDEDDEW